MTVAAVVRFCVVSSSIISHFGIKPVSGGSPPNESKISMVMVAIEGEVVHEVIMSLIFFEFSRIRA